MDVFIILIEAFHFVYVYIKSQAADMAHCLKYLSCQYEEPISNLHNLVKPGMVAFICL